MGLTVLLKAIFHGVQKHACALCLNINKIDLTLFPNHTGAVPSPGPRAHRGWSSSARESTSLGALEWPPGRRRGCSPRGLPLRGRFRLQDGAGPGRAALLPLPAAGPLLDARRSPGPAPAPPGPAAATAASRPVSSPCPPRPVPAAPGRAERQQGPEAAPGGRQAAGGHPPPGPAARSRPRRRLQLPAARGPVPPRASGRAVRGGGAARCGPGRGLPPGPCHQPSPQHVAEHRVRLQTGPATATTHPAASPSTRPSRSLSTRGTGTPPPRWAARPGACPLCLSRNVSSFPT